MTKYTINASRKIHYLFELEANTPNEAIDEMNRIDVSENAEDFAFEWEAFDVAEINEVK